MAGGKLLTVHIKQVRKLMSYVNQYSLLSTVQFPLNEITYYVKLMSSSG